MRIKRLFVVSAIIVLFLSCMYIMNKRFDRLSRYPYEDPVARDLINKTMTDEEINFIIEYSIDPQYFMEYIECKGFNVFHVESYDIAKKYCWYLSNNNIVELVEMIYKYDNPDNVSNTLSLLQYYNFKDIEFFLENGDVYGNAKELYNYPDDYHIILNDDVFIGVHEPYDLIRENSLILKENAYNSFIKALEEINNEYKCDDYGGILFESSYISYFELEKLYKKNRNIIPGHNEHQTGLCIDIDLSESIFNDNSKYVELKEILIKYGFKVSECELSKYHLRYNLEYATK